MVNHFVMGEIDKNVPLSFVAFTGNEAGKTHLVFQKRRFQSFISEMLRVASLLGEKKFILFSQLPWDKRNFKNFQAFYA